MAFGTATGGEGGSFTVTFNAEVTSEAVDALIQRLSYANVSDAPTATRALTLNVVDGAGAGLGGISTLTALTGSTNPFNGFDVGVWSKTSFVDLDGDGRLDLVSGANDGQFLAWRNTGSGFTALTGSANPFNGFDVGTNSAPSFVDLNGDGRLDLVSGRNTGTFAAWQNTGSGYTELTGTANPFNGFDVGSNSTPSFVDLDGDSRLDLVSGAENGTFLAWQNTGSGFTALTGVANPFNGFDVGRYSTPTFVDLDGDGRLDLVSGEYYGKFRAWQNTGNGYAELTGTANPLNDFAVLLGSTPSFADLDGNGRLALVSGNYFGQFLAWQTTTPLPTITVTVTAEDEAPANTAPSVTSAATANYAENGTGTAYQATATDPEGTTIFTWSLSGDDAELFNISSTGAVTFKTAPDYEAPAGTGGNNVYNIIVEANDGALTDSKAVAITVTNLVEQAALTGFGPTASFDENAVNATPELLDADVVFTAGESLVGGRLVVAGLLAEDRVSVLTEGNEAGEIGFDGSTVSYGGVAFGTATGGEGGSFTVTFNAEVTSAAVDALIQRLSYANVSDTPTATRALTLNVVDGAGTGLVGISALTALTGTANPFNGFDVGYNSEPSYEDQDGDGLLDGFNYGIASTPSFVDLDGDGRLDLVWGEDFGTFQAWKNTGSGYTALTGTDNPFGGFDVGDGSAPSFVDLDGDNLLDFVSGQSEGTFLAWRNTGSGYTQLIGTDNPFDGLNNGAFWSKPSFVDLNTDGLLDLVSGGYDGTFAAWQNTGSGYTALTGTANPFNDFNVGFGSKPSFVDLNGDGRLDLVSGVNSGKFVAWQNTGSGYTELTGAANPLNGLDVGWLSTPSFVDLDGDGRLDLVSGEEYGTFRTWRNTTPLPTITVTVTAEDDAPTITSAATAEYAENGTGTAYQATATADGPDAITWSLSGADAALFNISNTGAVTFNTAPNFETPADADGDNVYDIVVETDDGALTDSKAVAITVTNIVEPPAITGFGLTASFDENAVNATPELLDADVVFTAGDSLVDGRLVVDGLLAEDRVSVLTQGDAEGEIGFDGSTLSYGGVAFGTATGGEGGSFTVTFSAAVTSVAVDALIQRLSYANVSDTPTETRALTLNVVDGAGVGLVGISALAALTGSANPLNNLSAGTYSTPIFVDLDGDGRLDLVSGEQGGTFQAWQNTGSGYTRLTGTANPFNGLSAGSYSTPSFVDLGADGLLDLVSGRSNGTFAAWQNTGSGYTQLTGTENPFNGLSAGSYSTPSFVDLDGDSLLDLVSGRSDGTFAAWQNTGSGYTALTGTANPFNGFDAGNRSAPTFVDLNGDGRLDLVSGENGGTFKAWRNTTPLPTITVTVTAENDAPAITSAATADFAENGTGTVYQATATADGPDAITWSLSGADAALFNISNTGAVTFNTAPNFETPADADGNNVYDIVVETDDGALTDSKAVAITVTNIVEPPAITGFGPTASFAENAVNATPELLVPEVVFIAETSLVGGMLVVAGLLAEDRVSVLTQGDTEGEIGFDGSTVSYGGVAFGTATGGAGGSFTVTFSAAVTSVAVDALIQRLSYANVSDTPTATRALTLNVVDGAGTGLAGISTLTALTGSSNPFNEFDTAYSSTPSFVDLDGDGRLDLVSGEYYGTFLAWRNTGSGYTALAGSDNPFDTFDVGLWSAPSFVDLDGDGRLDLVSGERFGTFLAWRNTESGYTALTGTDNPFDGFDVVYASTPSFVDLDGDGHLDLVSGERFGTFLAWRNTGSGFTALTGSDNPFNGFDVEDYSTPSFVDLNADGLLDLVSGRFNGTFVAWHNTGSGYSELTGTANPFNEFDAGLYSAPSFMDLDADGRLDLVSGEDFGTLRAWRNTTPLPTITVTVTAEDDAPAITSADTADFAEHGKRTAYEATATDPEGTTSFTWSLSGDDAELFNISNTGAVTFKTAPDHETPADTDGDNVYMIVVEANDGALTGTQAVAITVTDILEGVYLEGGAGADNLVGTERSDTLLGLAGNDTLQGGVGPDSLVGGAGNDTYHIDDIGDVAEELAGEGYDSVLASRDWTLDAEIEQLSLTGTDSLTGTGNALANRLDGNAGANILDGGAGNDTLYGLGDNDTLLGGVGNDQLLGGAGDDSLTGGAGNDSLTGGAGVDIFNVSTGSGTDTVTDLGLGGADVLTIAASTTANATVVAAWTATADSSNDGTALLSTTGFAVDLALATGSAGWNVTNTRTTGVSLTGSGFNDTLSGGTGADTLIGGAGDDTLDGGAGADALTGGLGIDRFNITAGADTVTDIDGTEILIIGTGASVSATVAAAWTATATTTNSGTATILANGFTVSLAAVTGGTKGWSVNNTVNADVALTGSGLADTITGGAGNDTLNGGAGNDSLTGGAGVDIFNVSTGSGTDTVTDLGLGGADVLTIAASTTANATVVAAWTATADSSNDGTALLSTTGFAVDLALATGSAGWNVTNTRTTGVSLTGSGFNDTLSGGTGADTLIGGAGDDTLDGGAGSDSLTGGLGIDRFNIAAGADTVTDLGGAEILIVGTGASVNATVAAAWTATATTTNSGTATILANGFAVSLAAVTGGTKGWSVTNTVNADVALTGSALADTITGSTGADTLIGGAGNDILDGGDGADTLTGGLGTDRFNITAGVDTLTDLGGAEILIVGAGASVSATVAAAWTATATTINSGTATILANGFAVSLAAVTGGNGWSVTNTAAATVALTGSGLADTITGGAGNETLNGGAGTDSLDGGAGNDTLDGGAGDDTLTGGLGTDRFNIAAGADTVTDLDGADILIVGTGASVNATVAAAWTATATTTNGGTATILANGFSVSLAAVTAGSGWSVTNTVNANMALTGSGLADTITGGAGNETLNGGAGTDSLDGGAGNDTLDGGAGDDTLTGGLGTDRFNIAAGADTLTDLGGADILIVGTGASVSATVAAAWTATVTTTNSGTATILADGFAVSLAAVTGGTNGWSVTNTVNANVALTGSGLADTITGGAGNETLNGGAGNDSLDGGAGDDTLTGGLGTDRFNIAAGADTLTDLGGADILIVGLEASVSATVGAAWTATATTTNSGTATILANGFAVSLAAVTAGNGWSVTNTVNASVALTGSGLADTITGGAGNETLNGGAGIDSLNGGGGNDTLDGGAGADTLTGGLGIDRFNIAAGADTVTDLGGTEILIVGLEASVSATVAAAWTATATTTNSGTATILANGFAVSLAAVTGGTNGWSVTNGSETGVTLVGSAKADTLTGGAGNDTLTGGAGNDTLTGGAGNDTLDGGAGADSLTGGLGTDRFNIAAGADTVTDLGGAEILIVGTGASVNATVAAAWTATATTTNSGTATILANGFAVSLAAVTGGTNGWSVTNGSETGVTLVGSAKADTLTGGAGNDTLTGGGGADVFVLSQGGQDVINGFNGVDVISLAGWGIADFAALGGYMSNVGGNTFINLDATHQVTLAGVTSGSLVANDFIFG